MLTWRSFVNRDDLYDMATCLCVSIELIVIFQSPHPRTEFSYSWMTSQRNKIKDEYPFLCKLKFNNQSETKPTFSDLPKNYSSFSFLFIISYRMYVCKGRYCTSIYRQTPIISVRLSLVPHCAMILCCPPSFNILSFFPLFSPVQALGFFPSLVSTFLVLLS